MKKIKFIVNPISGINRNPQKIVQWINEVFSPSEDEIDIVYTSQPGDGTRLGEQAKVEGCTLVVAVGGDGTINEISSGLVNSSIPLGVIPAGSGNGFARNFLIPLNQLQAIKLLLNPRIISIDVGKINQHYFFNVAGIGLDALISLNFEKLGKRGPLPYFYVGIKSYLERKVVPIKVKFDNKNLEFFPLVISIANAPQYGNGAIIAPKAIADDGYLDLCILDDMPFWKAVLQMYRLFNGTIDKTKVFHSFQVKDLTLIRTHPGVIHTDGNPINEGSHLEIKVIPKALKLAVSK
jgi:YegS/Rv2252/BmrU family lipid kinase